MDKERDFNALFISASVTLTDNYYGGRFRALFTFGDLVTVLMRTTISAILSGMHEAIFANRSWM